MLDQLIGGGIGAVAGFGGDNYMMEDQQAFNAQQAQLNRQFQRDMSNTAYQRAARDMEKAGLNRILALGSPASTPGGAMAASGLLPGGSSAVQGAASALNAVSSAKSADQNVSESQERVKLLNEQAKKVSAEIENVIADTDLKSKQAGLTAEQTKVAAAEASKQVVLKSLYSAFEPLISKLSSTDATKAKKGLSRIADDAFKYVKESDSQKMGSDLGDMTLDLLYKGFKFIQGFSGFGDIEADVDEALDASPGTDPEWSFK